MTEQTRSAHRIRTFKPRRRPISPTRQRRFDELAPHWLVDPDGVGQLDLVELFGDDQPVVLDIGIGQGESCVEMATADPTTNVIGADVHTPGVAAALLAIDDRGLTNLRLLHGDALALAERLHPQNLAGVRIFFPDPWPKARHRNRRIVSVGRMKQLIDLLNPGGFVHLATDIDSYAAQMQQVCDDHPNLVGGVIERPAERPLTRYESRGVEAGRTITDLWYVTSGP